jgi:hypothetical protein
MPKINAEKILATDANNKIGSLNSNNNNSNASPTTINLIYDDTKSKKDKTEDKTKPNKSSKDNKSKGNVSSIGQKGSKTLSMP